MNWQLYIVKTKRAFSELESVSDPDASLGTLKEVYEKIGLYLPELEWDEPQSGYVFLGRREALHFQLGDEDHVSALKVTLSGDREGLLALVRLCAEAGWILYDAWRWKYLPIPPVFPFDEDAYWEAFMGIEETGFRNSDSL